MEIAERRGGMHVHTCIHPPPPGPWPICQGVMESTLCRLFVQFPSVSFEAEKAASTCRARLLAGGSPSELLTASPAERSAICRKDVVHGILSWQYAIRRRSLVTPKVEDEDLQDLQG